MDRTLTCCVSSVYVALNLLVIDGGHVFSKLELKYETIFVCVQYVCEFTAECVHQRKTVLE